MTDEVRSHLESGIFTLTIHRPDRRNALNQDVLTGLIEALRDAAANREVRVVTLTGAGDKVFCAGADLKSSLPEATAGRGLPQARRTAICCSRYCSAPNLLWHWPEDM